MKLKASIFCLLFVAMSTMASAAESLRVAKIFTDHMVFQQETSAPVWGWGTPGSKVVVKPSWSKQSYTTKVGDDESWRVSLDTPSHGGPYSVKITCGKECIELNDVFVGEVWICSGQSNMEMPLTGFVTSNQPVNESLETSIKAINYGDRIRIFTVPRNPAEEAPMKDLPSGEWKRASFESSASCSAIAYFFAEYITDAIDVPVGVIVSAWGGTEIRPWMPRQCHAEALKGLVSDQEYARRTANMDRYKGRPRTAGALYNGMIHPFKGFAARGFLWYQGCANARDNTFYDKLQAAMVEGWRKEWGDTEAKMPFYYVLIAPYHYGAKPEGFYRGYFVENQAKAAKLTPNSAYASTEGLGAGPIIHPAEKKPVSRQLALLALDRTYGVQCIKSGSPEVQNIKLADGKYVVEFEKGKNLLTPAGEAICGFEIAGEDKHFYPASAKVAGDRIIVNVPEEVAQPAALRYSFRNGSMSNVRSKFGFPLIPFRTDDWTVQQ